MTALERVMGVLDAHGCRLKASNAWRCPVHGNAPPYRLSVGAADDGRVLLHCFAGCDVRDVVEALGLQMADLFPRFDRRSGPSRAQRGGEGGASPPPDARTGAHPSHRGLTMAQYADAKRLPVEFLRSCGVSDVVLGGVPAVRLPYLDSAAAEVAVRFRLALRAGPDRDARFRWRKGSTSMPYGLNRLAHARAAGSIVLVEGESDCHTLWLHGFHALGIPGATTWRDSYTKYLEEIETVFLVVEPDAGGDALLKAVLDSSLAGRVRVVRLGSHKDPSDLYLSDPDNFPAALEAALGRADPGSRVDEQAADVARASAWQRCSDLAGSSQILEQLVRDLRRLGVVGEDRAAQLIYLAVTSRMLDKIVSVVAKGPSSAGKSFTVESVLRFFPPSAYYVLSGMSPHFLVYDDEPLSHRILVIAEATALEDTKAVYFVRTLLSEGHLVWGTLVKDEQGRQQAQRIERAGPTGVLLTTTAIQLHPENETRLLSVPLNDTAEQTKRIFMALALPEAESVDLTPWLALQEWLDAGEKRVAIPFAEALAEAMPPVAVRLRRDFALILNLVRAHALLHRASRGCGSDGRILASVEDYSVVRELVADLIGEAAQATVSGTVRETVGAVKALKDSGLEHVSILDLAKKLGLDRSSASRRWNAAREGGFLRNLEDRRGRPARIDLADPLPENVEILPAPEAVQQCVQVGGGTPPLPHPDATLEEHVL